jgi:hypothetical protein
MLVIVSEQYCVVRFGQTYYVCRRVLGGKLDCLCSCLSYQEAEEAHRQLNNGI